MATVIALVIALGKLALFVFHVFPILVELFHRIKAILDIFRGKKPLENKSNDRQEVRNRAPPILNQPNTVSQPPIRKEGQMDPETRRHLTNGLITSAVIAVVAVIIEFVLAASAASLWLQVAIFVLGGLGLGYLTKILAVVVEIRNQVRALAAPMSPPSAVAIATEVIRLLEERERAVREDAIVGGTS